MSEKYHIPENPAYHREIRKLQDTDPASASRILNPLFERLIENTAAVKAQTEETGEELKDTIKELDQKTEALGESVSELEVSVGKLEENSGNMEESRGKPGGLATLDENGQIPSGQLPAMNYDTKGAAATVQSKLDTHILDANLHVTADKQSKWNSGTQTATEAKAAASAAQTTANEAKTAAGNAQTAAEKAQAAADAGPTVRKYTGTLTTSWSGSGPYTQTVNVSGITADMVPVVGPVLSTATTTARNQLTAWGCVDKIVTNAGTITATCYGTKATTAIPIQLLVTM